MSLFNFFKRLVSSAPTPAPAGDKPAAAEKLAKPLKKAGGKRDHSQPIYDLAASGGARRMIEFGTGTGDRAEKLIAAASPNVAPGEIVYVGVDFFEAGATAPPPGATLRDVYKRLKATQAAVKLLPGDLSSTLGHLALTTSNYDLIVVGATFAEQNLLAAWPKLSRLLHPQGVVFVEEANENGSGFTLRRVDAAEAAQFAEAVGVVRATANNRTVVSATHAADSTRGAVPAMSEGRGPRPHFPATGVTRAEEPSAAATSTRKGS